MIIEERFKPKISIIIPIYNSEIYIKRAINSILSQTIQDFEVIIVDGGSTDKSMSEIKKYRDERIKLYQSKHTRVSTARNIGVSLARSDFIAFLDIDDEWTPIFIETMLRLKNKYTQSGMYVVNHVRTSKNNIENINIINYKDDVLPIANFFTQYLDNPTLIVTSAVAMHKKVFDEMKGFTEKAAWGEDEDLWCRIALFHPVIYSYTICVIYHITGKWQSKINRWSALTKEHPFIKNGKEALKKIKLPIPLREEVINFISRSQIISAKNNIIGGNFLDAKMILNEMNNHNFKWQKIYLLFWIFLSKLITQKGCQVLFYHHLEILIMMSTFFNQLFHIKIKSNVQKRLNIIPF